MPRLLDRSHLGLDIGHVSVIFIASPFKFVQSVSVLFVPPLFPPSPFAPSVLDRTRQGGLIHSGGAGTAGDEGDGTGENGGTRVVLALALVSGLALALLVVLVLGLLVVLALALVSVLALALLVVLAVAPVSVLALALLVVLVSVLVSVLEIGRASCRERV